MSDRGLAVSITAITSIIVTTIALALRFYVRCFLLHRLQADDALILFCWIVFVAYLYCVLQQVKLGLGQHLEVVLMHPENIEKLLLVLFYSLQVESVQANRKSSTILSQLTFSTLPSVA